MDKRTDRPARVNPLVKFVSNRVMLTILVAVIIVASCGSLALFAPITFQSMVKAAQSAGLKTYTLVLGITGNPALKVVTYDADVTANTSVSRDMGLLGLLYGEGAQIIGTVRVSLGADLKNNKFGVLACDVDPRSVRTTENRAPFAGAAFDVQQIKQEAYVAFEHQAAAMAISSYWTEARRRLQGQFTSWALGVTAPEQPTLTDCPANAPTAVATPAR